MADAKDPGPSIFETLESLGVASLASRELFSPRTRDRADLPVYRDRQSGVIYIDGFYTGDETYQAGSYRAAGWSESLSRNFEIAADAERRQSAYRPYFTGKAILDFGCGDGAFLRTVAGSTASSLGVELQADYVNALTADGIPCADDLAAVPRAGIDTAFSFHVIEHLPAPVDTLAALRETLKPGGLAVVEVPHAGDFLLTNLACDPFKAFTLWSQHLVLHTRESLRRLMLAAGFEAVQIEGIQRYPLSNHLTWLQAGKPGGHKSALAALDTPEMIQAYQASLRKIDATDTLVAIARRPAV